MNWRTPDVTLAALHALPFATEPGLSAVVVENGSGDNSADVLRAGLAADPAFARVVLLQNEENSGFTGGVNAGAERALQDPSLEALWLLNPDARIPAGAFEELSTVLSQSCAAAVSPCLGENGGRWSGEHKFPRAFWARPADYSASRVPGARWWASQRYEGSCALFEADAVRGLILRDGHFLQPGIFMYWDEWECSLRLERSGATIAVAGNVCIGHDGGTVVGNGPLASMRQYYFARNAVAVVRPHVAGWRFFLLLALRIARDTSWHLRVRLRGRRINARAYWLGTFDGLRGRSGRWKSHPK